MDKEPFKIKNSLDMGTLDKAVPLEYDGKKQQNQEGFICAKEILHFVLCYVL